MLFKMSKKKKRNTQRILYTLHAREEYRQLSLSIGQEEMFFSPNYKNT